jgi:hypothetical protein
MYAVINTKRAVQLVLEVKDRLLLFEQALRVYKTNCHAIIIKIVFNPSHAYML